MREHSFCGMTVCFGYNKKIHDWTAEFTLKELQDFVKDVKKFHDIARPKKKKDTLRVFDK